MKIIQSIRDNLRFLIVEVDGQIGALREYLKVGQAGLAQHILDRGGYAYNLKLRIHESCIKQLPRRREGDPQTHWLRAIQQIATDLEGISELCRECAMLALGLKQPTRVKLRRYRRLLQQVKQGLARVEPALQFQENHRALKLGQVEERLSHAYGQLLKGYIKGLKTGSDTEDLVSGLFLAQGIKQMGDLLLSISESILSANLGQPVNMERYYSIQASLSELAREQQAGPLQIAHVADTRSGSSIAAVTRNDGGRQNYLAIYKDGQKRKLKEEREGVESWHQIYPGLAPKILSYRKRGQSAALLIEHLPGLTFEQILLRESPQLLAETLGQLTDTLASVWQATRSDKGVGALCGVRMDGIDQLLRLATERESRIKTPFSVYIHGDFNVDNILYDALEKKINFIDLHRSCHLDYVQDVSVFMVSNYRLQIVDAPTRRRIMSVVRDFYDFAAGFAAQSGDRTFDLRLALGLARSFITSTRFILDQSLALAMFLRGRYLIEQVLAVSSGGAKDYRLPIREIFIE
jgi:hypothetical protein